MLKSWMSTEAFLLMLIAEDQLGDAILGCTFIIN